MTILRSRILCNDELGHCERWQVPLLDGPVGEKQPAPEPPMAQAIEAVYQQAHDEGFALGRREGREQGQREARDASDQRIERLQQLLDQLALPLRDLNTEVERSLVDLSVSIARHLVRREIKAKPGEIIAVVREAIAHLPLAARQPRIHLHPEDMELVRNALGIGEEERAWRLDPDPLISRGGCLVETETSVIDATVEARLNAVIAAMLGGQGEDDR